MSRYTGPKNRLARREGVDIGLKTPGSNAHVRLLRRLKIGPGQHGQRRRRKVSDYGLQLREKQKVKRMYGLNEKQFRRYFEIASHERGNTGDTLLKLLERRLDNVVYRLHLAPTRTSARQYISHGHVTVDGKNVTIPSSVVSPGMVVSLRPILLATPVVTKLLEEENILLAPWLSRSGPVGKVVSLPTREDIGEPIDEQLIIEFYSR